MKAIINEKLYDTTTSEVVYIVDMEALYKNQNGAYFRTSSEGIQPMGIEGVKEYLGIKDVDAYIKEFGSVDIA